MDFYVGPAVLTLDGLTVGVTAFIDSSASRGLYIWGGFLDSHDQELRLTAVEAVLTRLALPGREGSDIDVVYTCGAGIGRASRVDRKSTRLNSSHVKISYAVFCLKKKKK